MARISTKNDRDLNPDENRWLTSPLPMDEGEHQKEHQREHQREHQKENIRKRT